MFSRLVLATCLATPLVAAEKGAAPEARAPQVTIEARFFEITAETAPALAALTRVDGVGLTPGTGGAIAGVFTTEQAANAMRALTATQGVDLLSAPRVVTRSSQRASIEIAREFRHPVAWKKNAQSGAWEPDKFETKNTGISFGLEAQVNGDGTLDLLLEPEVVEFAGFQDLDAPGQPMKTVPDPARPFAERMLQPQFGPLLPAGHRARAVFRTHKLGTSLTVWAGQSVLLELGQPQGAEPPPRRLFTLVTADVLPPEPQPAAAAAPKSTLQEKAEKLFVPKLEFDGATVRECAAHLARLSRSLDPEQKGVSIVVKLPETDTTKVTLSLENVPLSETLKYLAELAGLELETGRDAFLLRPPADKTPAMPQPAAGTPEALLLARARGIVLPRVEFKNATVAESVEFLRKKSAEHDIEKKGVNIVLKPATKGPETSLTLSLTDVSVAEALGYVAQLAGFQLEVGPSAFLLRPRGE